MADRCACDVGRWATFAANAWRHIAPSVTDLAHLFLECWISKSVWREIIALVKCFSDTNFRLALDYRVVLFNIIPPPVRKRLNLIIVILINLGKKVIWEIRNKIKFENRHFSPAAISALTLSRIRQRVRTDQHLMDGDRFFSFWLRRPSGVSLGYDGNPILGFPRRGVLR